MMMMITCQRVSIVGANLFYGDADLHKSVCSADLYQVCGCWRKATPQLEVAAGLTQCLKSSAHADASRVEIRLAGLETFLGKHGGMRFAKHFLDTGAFFVVVFLFFFVLFCLVFFFVFLSCLLSRKYCLVSTSHIVRRRQTCFHQNAAVPSVES